MASTYNLTLTNGSALTTLRALEGNGTGNLSVPRQILDINFDSSNPYIIVADDVTARFVNNFAFSIVGNSPYAGNYTVAAANGSTAITLSNGQTATRIKLTTTPVSTGFTIVNVVTGTSGSWIISGPSNGNLQFYPTSIFSVTGNTFGGANTTYTVNTATTGSTFQVSTVVTGSGGHFTIPGNQTLFFRANSTFNIINAGGYDQLYTISSASYVSGHTQINVVEAIPTETIVTVDTLIVLTIPITVITVAGSINASAASNGIAHPASPTIFSFISSSAVVITPTTAHNYLVTFRLTGDRHLALPIGSTFTPHNVLYNGNSYTNAFTVVSSVYTGVYTEIGVNIVDMDVVTPVITVDSVTSWIIYPVPAIPYGYVQYTAPISTSLQLIGPGSPTFNATTTWGNAFTNNAVHMLENFANSTAPASPLTGQLWYDTTAANIKLYNGSVWGILPRLVASVPANSAAAGHPGDYFVDNTALYIYGTNAWRKVLISAF